jgi:recombination protein RecR
MELPKSIQNFIKIFSTLPGIGPRQATRIAFWLLHQEPQYQKDLVDSLNNIITKTKLCADCFFVFEPKNNETLCEICRDSRRDHTTICVVEKETDLISIEKTNKYKGVYHVLGGLMSEIDEKQNKTLKIPELLNRIKDSFNKRKPIKEIIIALSPTSEGNLTAYYLERQLKSLKLNFKITKLGRGLPHGGEVEFADSETLINALEGRK